MRRRNNNYPYNPLSADFNSNFRGHDLNDRIRGTLGTRRGEHYSKGPRNWKKSDETLREEVCEALYESGFLDASDIDVKVEGGLVFLRGSVESRTAKREAERCAEEVNGIHDIQNELKVA